MTINTEYLGTPGSDATTVFSDLSISGTIDTGELEVTGATTQTGALTCASTVAIGGGTAIAKVSSATYAVVAMTCTANKSTTTTVTWSGATTANDETDPDTYIVAAKSAFSAGVVVDAYASTKDTVTIRYSNVSGADAVLAAQTMRITRVEF